MIRIHPNTSYAVALAALIASVSIGGCRNPSGGFANPFLAPDRVPPPATRAILPGQAQPYYPGDPLPVMQSNAAPVVDNSGLAWTAPKSDAPRASSPSPAGAAAFSTEPTVAIPADGGSLRFALPAAVEPAPITPVAPTPIQVVAAPSNESIVQASYNEPVISDAAPVATSPWRPPQIAESVALPPPPIAQPLFAQPVSPMQLAALPNSMDVRMRAVSSPPPPEPMEMSVPRIRLPGEAPPQSASHDGFRPRRSMR
ncbi:MAG: hypothetical protein WD738_24165 [Pirellulales bacterium]